LFERLFIVRRLFFFMLLVCCDGFGKGGFDNLGKKKVCDAVKVRVRACTGVGVEYWGGCEEVDQSIAWEVDCEKVKSILRFGNLENEVR